MIEKTGTTETGITMYNSVNVIVDLIKAPGPLFNIDQYGINHGVIFVGIIGTILAITAIALGVPDTHVVAPPSMIFGFAPTY
jgi:hypothetical protein